MSLEMLTLIALVTVTLSMAIERLIHDEQGESDE